MTEWLMRVPSSDAERAAHYRQAVGFLQHAQAIEDAVIRELAAKLTRQGRPLTSVETMGSYHIYGNLGLAQLRLGDFSSSIAAYQRMLRLEPAHATGLLGLGKAYAGRGDDAEAAICMLQALMMSGGVQSFWNEVIAHYATRYSTSDAVVAEDGQRKLNLRSALVQVHVCEAYRRMAQRYRVAGNEEMARQAEETARREYGCR